MSVSIQSTGADYEEQAVIDFKLGVVDNVLIQQLPHGDPNKWVMIKYTTIFLRTSTI